MRTLTNQKQKTKPTKDNKKSSKKMIKTTFFDPFYYKIQTLDYEDSLLLQNKMCSYFDRLRLQGKFKKPIIRQKFIKFQNNKDDRISKNQIKSPLIDEDLYIGLKMNIKMMKNTNQKLHPVLVVVFYQEKKHEIFVQILCNLIYQKIPYIITRQNKIVTQKYGIKTLSSIGIKNQDHKLFKQLFELSSKCMIQIPWLVQKQWVSLNKNKI